MSLKPVIDVDETLGKELLLVDVTKRFIKKQDETGKYQSTSEFYFIYSVVAIERKFEKIDIKISEQKTLFPIDEFGKVIGLPDDCYVKFENLIITPYVMNGWIQISAKADKCILLNEV